MDRRQLNVSKNHEKIRGCRLTHTGKELQKPHCSIATSNRLYSVIGMYNEKSKVEKYEKVIRREIRTIPSVQYRTRLNYEEINMCGQVKF